MASPTRDASDWPLLRVYLPSRITPEEYTAHLDAMSAYFERNERFGILIDARSASALTAEQRRELAARLKGWHAAHPGSLVAVGVVCHSILQRGVVTAVNWLLRPAHGLRSFQAPDDAARWLLTCVAVAHSSMPPRR